MVRVFDDEGNELHDGSIVTIYDRDPAHKATIISTNIHHEPPEPDEFECFVDPCGADGWIDGQTCYGYHMNIFVYDMGDGIYQTKNVHLMKIYKANKPLR